MGRLSDILADNAADLLFNLAAFLIVYVIARLFRAGPVLAMGFAVMPLLIAYLMQHPDSSTRLFALLR